MIKDILKYLWDRRTTVLGYLQIVFAALIVSQGLLSDTVIKWCVLFNGVITAILGHYNNSRTGMGVDIRPVPPPRDAGFARVPMFVFIVLIALLCSVLSGCAANNPVNRAESFEQKAYALYGTYVIFQGKAADLVGDPIIPDNIKTALRQADAVSYPIADGLVVAALEVTDIRGILNQCAVLPEPDPTCVPTNEQRLINAISNLSSIYFDAQPVLMNLVTAVKTARCHADTLRSTPSLSLSACTGV